jgi:hypothetical protein
VNRIPGNVSITALSVIERKTLERRVPDDFDRELQALNSHLQQPTSSRTRFRLQALELLRKLYLPQPCQDVLRNSSLSAWLPIVCELEGESQALDHSLFTFCVIQVAITKTGSACVDDAMQVYHDALQKLLVELESDGAGQSDEILAAISVLSTCEVILLCP